jgi:2-oxoglutarate dehydrogenase E1 component
MGSTLKAEAATSFLSGTNMAYVDALYQDYLADATSVSLVWRQFFEALPSGARPGVAEGGDGIRQQLIDAYRTFGHWMAPLDPLHMHAPMSEADFYQNNALPSDVGTRFSGEVARLKATYCGSIGFEFMHISELTLRDWWLLQVEPSGGRRAVDAEEQRALFDALVAADGLERYLGTKYVGQKRFSLEGGDALIPMMKALLARATKAAVREVVIGMAHRGRLNMLVNVLGKSPQSLCDAFEGKISSSGTGDVKYHLGFSSDLKMPGGEVLHVALAFNPSHLEIIGPVVEGSVRARLCRQHDCDEKSKVLPVLIHGDAAFAGQGVVMEMLNFSQTPGFGTGGTVHIVVNNQIGFTTSDPHEARSTRYCTDIAKMIEAPVLHVNGDDVEAVVFAMQLAFDFRQQFKRDVVIDLICYRRHGHNEADEPSVTQPTMYQHIKAMQPLRDIYGQRLVQAGVLSADVFQTAYEKYRDKLDQGQCLLDLEQGSYKGKISNDWTPYLKTKWTAAAQTKIDLSTLKRLTAVLETLPAGFTPHPIIAKLLAERQKMLEGALPINWGYAETLAYASLLDVGYGVRLTGQDVGRGTFAHRQAVLHDFKTGALYLPLTKCVKDPHHGVEVIDSLLSEEAVLAFEYGYACSEPQTLVLWEAQFGDFANGAQVVIDQFISSGEQKWERLCGLVMLLPHGYEGQGPEHSSARLERYMQLCAQHNIQVCVPTTPAQIFHLLRRQIVRPFRKPLIVMTPKSLLRHKLAVSSVKELTSGAFQPLIPEVDDIPAAKVTKLIVCSGKVYYDLLQYRRDKKLQKIAIVRLEQLYPFPEEAFRKVLATYPKVKQIVWCQEEPENQGAWFASQHHLRQCMGKAQTLSYAGRAFAASPAVGSAVIHAEQQAALVKEALSEYNKEPS